ncbi:hypothetical protein FBY30_2743 [Arthrobacter sp. SLBN-83]|uniref:hypothetical protein n=1 Tax=Arthrobacter sp. SLBN-83 TaxID=2768449 RepID=UPI0011502971|nr:hypothetical protein [Arthrobacter sp. SLBN-83]TQJ60475.1 hypothetical protein FBY30_2743 [Arthrobacter sp. SLBN-83]
MAVEFISYGYDTAPGEGLGELVWQEMFPGIGTASYAVRSPTDWKVSPVSGADRTVSIAAGRGFGLGVIDKTVSNDTIQLDPITSGSRWDLIACRRDPTPTKGKSEFIKINGGSTQVIPGGRLSGPGIHDQPLALVQVTAGQTQPTSIIDLRTWSGDGGGLVAAHDLVRSFLNQVGTRLSISGIDWVRRVGDNDTPVWVKLGEAGKVSLYGFSGGRVGGVPPADTQFLVQKGTTVIPQEVNGYGTIWLKPFPNGVISANVNNGDVNTTGRGWSAEIVDLNTIALYVNLANGSGVGYSKGIWRCDWEVTGW